MTKIKVSGTGLDRRVKTATIREEIVDFYYNNADYTQQDVAEKYGISRTQVQRYLNYDKALEQARKDSKKYYDNQQVNNATAFKARKRISNKRHNEYVDHLADAKANFTPSC